MKHTKKTLTILISIVLLFTAVPFTNASAADETQYGFTYASQDGKATLISYNPASETDYVLHDVVIPSQTPDGDTVTAIAEGAFNDTSCGIRTISIPETVTQLSPDCFISRSNVGAFSAFYVDENNPVYSSEDGVLFNKDKTELVCAPSDSTNFVYYVPEGVEVIGEGAFACNVDIKHIVLPSTLKKIGNDTFAGDMRGFTIPEGVTEIGEDAFWRTNIEYIILPESLKTIGNGAFSFLDELDIYYAGSQEQWSEITIGSENENLTNGNIMFNSTPEKAPDVLDSGKCGENAYWTLFAGKYNHGILSITGEGATDDYYGETYPEWQEHLDCINTVIIDEGITYIGAYSFWNAKEISTFVIPSTVTDVGAGAFTTYHEAHFLLDEPHSIIVFQGSPKQWYNISFDVENEEVFYNWLVWIDDIGYTTIDELTVFSYEDTVDFGYSTMIYADPTCLPYGTYIKWSSNNDSLIVEPYESAHACLVTSSLNGQTEITASFEYMSWFDCSDSAETESASITITSKASIIEIIRYIIRSFFDIIRLLFKF